LKLERVLFVRLGEPRPEDAEPVVLHRQTWQSSWQIGPEAVPVPGRSRRRIVHGKGGQPS
jgi:hypothetical protein